MATRQPRAGRFPLPSSVRRLDESDGPALTPVHRFLDEVCELPLGDWLEIGRRLAGDQVGAAARSASWASLARVLVDQRLGVAAWQVRDAVATAVFLAARTATRLSRRQHRELLAAQGAAEEASLALLAREHLGAADYEALLASFAQAIPAGDRRWA